MTALLGMLMQVGLVKLAICYPLGVKTEIKTEPNSMDEQWEIMCRPNLSNHAVFTARCYASAVLAMGLCLSVCLSVSVSVTSRSSTKTARRRITQTTPHDSPGTLVFWCQTSPRNSTGVTPYEGAECRWGGSKSATFDE